jgi:hypothetical protein
MYRFLIYTPRIIISLKRRDFIHPFPLAAWAWKYDEFLFPDFSHWTLSQISSSARTLLVIRTIKSRSSLDGPQPTELSQSWSNFFEGLSVYVEIIESHTTPTV